MKQSDCRGEPGAAVCGKAGLKPGPRLLDRTLRRWGGQTSASAFQRVFRKAGGQGRAMLFLLTAAPGAPAFLQEACPACGRLCQPCLLPAHWLGAAQVPTMQPALVHPMPLGSGQKWIQKWMFCSCCGTSVYHRALSLQGIMLRVLINTNLINTSGRERPRQYGETFPHRLSGEVQMLHKKGIQNHAPSYIAAPASSVQWGCCGTCLQVDQLRQGGLPGRPHLGKVRGVMGNYPHPK